MRIQVEELIERTAEDSNRWRVRRGQMTLNFFTGRFEYGAKGKIDGG